MNSHLETTEQALKRYAQRCLDACQQAKQILQEQADPSPIADMAREILVYAAHLAQFDHMLGEAYIACTGIADSLYEHPRLLLQLKQLALQIVEHGEEVEHQTFEVKDELRADIARLQANIQAADEGRWEDIQTGSMLRIDPVEWTRAYEDVVDQADREAYARLTDCPRGMGFCFAYWAEKRAALARHGIDWNSPQDMNPGVMFD